MILFLLQIYFNIFKKVFPLNNTIKRTFSALSWTSFSHCGKFSPKLKRRGHSPPYSKLHADRRFFLHLKGLQRAHEPLCVDVEFPFVIMHLILFPQQLDDLL